MKLSKYIAVAIGLISITPFSQASIEETKEKANQGDNQAQLELGYHYCMEEKDYLKALEWFEKAAQHGGVLEQSIVADMYYDGKCVLSEVQEATPNYQKALKWYSRFAYRSNPSHFDAYYTYQGKLKIADIYFFEKGGIKGDPFTFKRLYNELANLTDDKLTSDSIRAPRGKARYRLAQMYYFGLNAPQDPELAYQWATKASADYSFDALVMLAKLEYQGRGVAQNKQKAIERMRRLCDIWGEQSFCDDYQKMSKNLPVD